MNLYDKFLNSPCITPQPFKLFTVKSKFHVYRKLYIIVFQFVLLLIKKFHAISETYIWIQLIEMHTGIFIKARYIYGILSRIPNCWRLLFGDRLNIIWYVFNPVFVEKYQRCVVICDYKSCHCCMIETVFLAQYSFVFGNIQLTLCFKLL